MSYIYIFLTLSCLSGMGVFFLYGRQIFIMLIVQEFIKSNCVQDTSMKECSGRKHTCNCACKEGLVFVVMVEIYHCFCVSFTLYKGTLCTLQTWTS